MWTVGAHVTLLKYNKIKSEIQMKKAHQDAHSHQNTLNCI